MIKEKQIKLIVKFCEKVHEFPKKKDSLRIQYLYRLGMFVDSDSNSSIPALGPGWQIVADFRDKEDKWKECSIYLED